MKVISERKMKSGATRVTVDLVDGEQLVGVQSGRYYRLGYPADDEVIRADQITEAREVSWCVIEQKWVE